MKHILAAALPITSPLPAPQLHAASPVRATLTLPHDTVLPGVPFDLVVTYTPLGTVQTPAVTLTRIAPAGIDAELWERMQEVSDGGWSNDAFKTTKPGVALANEIIQLHPSSGYYPYVVALRAFDVRQKGKNQIPVLLEAAERFPSSPAYPYLLSAAADCARYAGWVALDEGNLAEAKTYLTLADSKYRQALATKSVAIRKSSELGLYNVTDGLERATKKLTR